MASRLPDSVRVIRLPGGYQGTVGVVRLMAELVRKRYQHPRLRARARELFAGVQMFDLNERLRRLYEFLTTRITFTPNPLELQHLTDPVRLDEEIDAGLAGECCASIATYAAALLAAVGVRSEFEILGWDAQQPRQFRHVALRVYGPGGQKITFDPVGGMAYGGNFDVGDTLARDGLPVEHWGMDGARLDGLGDTYTDVRTAIDAVKTLVNLVPVYGPMASEVIQIGEDVYDRVSGSYLGRAAGLPGSTLTPATPPKAPAGKTPMLTPKAVAAGSKSNSPEGSSSTGTVAAAVGLPLAAWLLFA